MSCRAKTRIPIDSPDQRVMPPLSSFQPEVRGGTEVILRLGCCTHARRYGGPVEESTTCLAIAPLTSSCELSMFIVEASTYQIVLKPS
jgi:hypothetical protein